MDKSEIKLLYNSNKEKDKKTYALIQSFDNVIVNELDVCHVPLTEKLLADISEKVSTPIHDLFDKKAADYKSSFSNLSEHDVLTSIKKNPSLLQTPIAIKNNSNGLFLKSDKEAIAMDLEIHSNNQRPTSEPVG